MITYELAITDEAIHQILDLQQRNLKKNVPAELHEKQGFVTAEHSFETLKHINDDEQASIAVFNGKVIAYAIAMTRNSGEIMPIFDELFNITDHLIVDEKQMTEYKYIFVGQLCVDKDFAGQGVAVKLYNHFREHFAGKYDFVITDISSLNPRSLRTHEKAGFKIIHSFFDEFTQSIWEIVLMDLRTLTKT